jgi:hypothetical protein
MDVALPWLGSSIAGTNLCVPPPDRDEDVQGPEDVSHGVTQPLVGLGCRRGAGRLHVRCDLKGSHVGFATPSERPVHESLEVVWRGAFARSRFRNERSRA